MGLASNPPRTTAELVEKTVTVATTVTETVTKPEVYTVTETRTVREAVTETVTLTLTMTTTQTVTRTITETTTKTITATPTVPPCAYRQLFSRTVSNAEGDEVLVWKGSIDYMGTLTIKTCGCSCNGTWSIRVKNAGWDSGWIEVPCIGQCSFRVVPGGLEVWVGWCKGRICALCIDQIDINGILEPPTEEVGCTPPS